MLRVTFEAKALIADRFDRESHPLRLAPPEDDEGDDPVRLEPDAPRSGDLSFSHQGDTLLLVDGELATELDGRELDADPSGRGWRLVLRKRGLPGLQPLH